MAGPMVKLSEAHLDRDIEFPGLGTTSNLLRASEGWDLTRDEPWSYVRMAHPKAGVKLLHASRFMYVEDASPEEKAAAAAKGKP